MDYQKKYLKYKIKYLEAKTQSESGKIIKKEDGKIIKKNGWNIINVNDNGGKRYFGVMYDDNDLSFLEFTYNINGELVAHDIFFSLKYSDYKTNKQKSNNFSVNITSGSYPYLNGKYTFEIIKRRDRVQHDINLIGYEQHITHKQHK